MVLRSIVLCQNLPLAKPRVLGRSLLFDCCFHFFKVEMTRSEIVKRKEFKRNIKIVMNAPNLLLAFKRHSLSSVCNWLPLKRKNQFTSQMILGSLVIFQEGDLITGFLYRLVTVR